MRPGLALALCMMTLLLISGCTQTGRVAEGDLTQGEEQALGESLNETQDACRDSNCSGSVTICPDGYNARCENHCMSGACTRCTPNCSGHEMQAPCPECGDCQILDTSDCSCDTLIPCDGNGICEEGEYPGQDCPACQGQDPCTLESYDYSSQLCIYEILVPCCGNWECEEGESHELCPEDCEEIPDIRITDLDPEEEWAEIQNLWENEMDMTGWIIKDTLASPRVVFEFPAFTLEAGSFVYILKGYGEDNDTYLYRNRDNNVWNNDGDTAVLIDNTGRIISQYSYGG